MDLEKAHPFHLANADDRRQQLCKCGKTIGDPIHVVDVKVMRGIARPTKVG
jgi:hypothetical protein